MTIHIEFEPVGRRGECPSGQSLLDCARQLGVELVNLCGGVGTCGRCKVRILGGQVSALTPKEQTFLTPQELEAGYRLACRTVPLSDCKVLVPPESLTAPQRTLVEGQEIAVKVEPPVRVYAVRLAPPSHENGDRMPSIRLAADAERLLDALKQQHQNDASVILRSERKPGFRRDEESHATITDVLHSRASSLPKPVLSAAEGVAQNDINQNHQVLHPTEHCTIDIEVLRGLSARVREEDGPDAVYPQVNVVMREGAFALGGKVRPGHGDAPSTATNKDISRYRSGGIPMPRSSVPQTTNAPVRDGQEIVALLAPSRRPLGLAVDLGTTKIAAYVVDLQDGRTLASLGRMNPQIAYGEDLIARMMHAKKGPAEAAQLQGMVVETLNHMAADMCERIDADPADIVEAVVVGNTAMHHLFLRLPVAQLVRAPYTPAVQSALDVKARDVGLRIAPGAYVHLLPNIAGYVGADHVAMLLAIELAQAEGVVLALDVGTNTEICLASQGVLTSVSCASGPAFEGAHIQHGMRAADGAIEHVRWVDGRIEYQTIGGGPPVGLCGSGILDTLAQLYQAGVVDWRGQMGEHARVRGAGMQREFVLVGEDEREDGRPAITFTQKDVRELQLAKGAMRAGIEVLLATNDLVAEDIDQIIIAGAFGTYIDVASAISVGMLPALPLDRFRQVGNAAGMGAKLALISRSKRAEAQAIASRVGYVELATDPQFARIFARAMYLGQSQ